MPTFSYTARDRSGNVVSGIIEAAEDRAAAASLRDQGLWPMRVDYVTAAAAAASAPSGAANGTAGSGFGFPSPPPVTPPPAYTPPPITRLPPDLSDPLPPPSGSGGFGTSFTPSSPTSPYAQERLGAQSRIDAAPFLVSVPLPELAAMYEQLGTLQNAGVPLVQSLSTLAEQTRNGRLKSILKEAALTVAGGNPLSAVLVRHPSVFNSLQVELIRAGEASGLLEMMCQRIAAYLHREIDIRRKLNRETLYPKIVLFVAGCVLVLLTYLKAGQASALGKVELAGEILVAGFLIWWLSRFLNQFPAFGAAWDGIKLLIPGPGGVSRRYATARFTRALGTLYAGGVLLPNAVAIAARSCGNRAIGERLLKEVPRLHAGEGISGMLAASGLLSPIAIQMARTGEHTGNLDTMMEKVSDYLESEADMKSHQLAVASGVVALMVAAGVVLYIAVTFYMGAFSQAMNAAGNGND